MKHQLFLLCDSVFILKYLRFLLIKRKNETKKQQEQPTKTNPKQNKTSRSCQIIILLPSSLKLNKWYSHPARAKALHFMTAFIPLISELKKKNARAKRRVCTCDVVPEWQQRPLFMIFFSFHTLPVLLHNQPRRIERKEPWLPELRWELQQHKIGYNVISFMDVIASSARRREASSGGGSRGNPTGCCVEHILHVWSK